MWNSAARCLLFIAIVFTVGCKDGSKLKNPKVLDEVLTYNEFTPLSTSQLKHLASVKNRIADDGIGNKYRYCKIKNYYHAKLNPDSAKIYADRCLRSSHFVNFQSRYLINNVYLI